MEATSLAHGLSKLQGALCQRRVLVKSRPVSGFAPNSLALPCVLGGRYEARKRIGSGGMGEVYLARQLGLERDVAVKLLSHIPTDAGQEERIKERFRREAVALSRLRHPNTVQVIDYGFSDDDRPFIVTELLEGVGLDELLERERVLPVQRAIHIVTQTAMSLAEAHHHGIVHRDLKPSNIFLTQAFGKPDFVKVIDFGVARVDGADEIKQRPLTVEGTTLGTPDYMAPEQARGTKPLPATDVYALGCMLYELLTGSPPFTGESALQVMIAHIRDTAKPLRVARPDLGLPEGVELLIRDCLAKDASQRPENAGKLVGLLEALQADLEEQKRRPEVSNSGSAQRPPKSAVREPPSEVEAGFRKPVSLKRRGGRRNDDGEWEDSVVAPLPDLQRPVEKAPAPRSVVSPPPAAPPKPAAAPSPAHLTPMATPMPEISDEVQATRLDVRPLFDDSASVAAPTEPAAETSGARRLIRGHRRAAPIFEIPSDEVLETRPEPVAEPAKKRWLWPLVVLGASGLGVATWLILR